jgi:hypothetical protein
MPPGTDVGKVVWPLVGLGDFDDLEAGNEEIAAMVYGDNE